MALTNAPDRIVWIDCEMTGLSLVTDQLVEIAAIVTDSELNEIDEGVSVVIRPADMTSLQGMDPYVLKMHTDSGLLPLIEHGISLQEAGEVILGYVKQHVAEPRKAPLAGSSVYVDRGFLARDLPGLDEWLHYRLIDVSSFKEVTRRWYPRVYFNAPAKTGNHRALADIRESIAELRYYRAAIMVESGPDSEQAKALASSFVVDHH